MAWFEIWLLKCVGGIKCCFHVLCWSLNGEITEWGFFHENDTFKDRVILQEGYIFHSIYTIVSFLYRPQFMRLRSWAQIQHLYWHDMNLKFRGSNTRAFHAFFCWLMFGFFTRDSNILWSILLMNSSILIVVNSTWFCFNEQSLW